MEGDPGEEDALICFGPDDLSYGNAYSGQVKFLCVRHDQYRQDDTLYRH